MTLRFLARQRVLQLVDMRQLAVILRLSRFLRRRPPSDGHRSTGGAGASEQWRNLVGETQFDPHRFYPAAWAGRLLAKSRPSVHGDIGSRAPDVGALSALVPVTFYVDHQPLQAQLPGLATVAGDITRLPFPDKSLISLSSLHVVGRIRPGRDAIEPGEDLKALGELQRVLGYRGSLYLSVPVGRERVRSKVQRIFAPHTILAAVPFLRLRHFTYIGDDGVLHADAPLEEAARQDYGCGLFEFERA
jgi:hypothetical protein